MTEQEKYVRSAAAIFKDCLEILNERSKKYTGDGDPFANFKASASVARIDVTQGIMSRFGDKLGRIQQGLDEHLFEDGVKLHEDESFRDSVIDGINYLNILLLWLETAGGESFSAFLSNHGFNAPEQMKLPELEDAEEKGWFEKLIKR